MFAATPSQAAHIKEKCGDLKKWVDVISVKSVHAHTRARIEPPFSKVHSKQVKQQQQQQQLLCLE